jgi:hypothetical protein
MNGRIYKKRFALIWVIVLVFAASSAQTTLASGNTLSGSMVDSLRRTFLFAFVSNLANYANAIINTTEGFIYDTGTCLA